MIRQKRYLVEGVESVGHVAQNIPTVVLIPKSMCQQMRLNNQYITHYVHLLGWVKRTIDESIKLSQIGRINRSETHITYQIKLWRCYSHYTQHEKCHLLLGFALLSSGGRWVFVHGVFDIGDFHIVFHKMSHIVASHELTLLTKKESTINRTIGVLSWTNSTLTIASLRASASLMVRVWWSLRNT